MPAALQPNHRGLGFGQRREQPREVVTGHGASRCVGLHHMQRGVLQPARGQFRTHLFARLNEPRVLLLRDLEQRRAGDEHVPGLDQFAHLAEEEREQQRADVLPVHVGVGHDDDLAVADLAHVLDVVDVHADGRDQCGDFVVLQQLLQLGLLDVEHLSAKRQNGLVHPVAATFRAAAGRITFDEEQFVQFALA